MSSVRTLQRSFAGGIITPELFGRIDLTKFQTGLADCENFIILPHGPAANRPGLEYIAATKTANKAARLIPFSYSTTQTYALEFGDQYIRFYTQGARLLTGTVTAWVTATVYAVGDIRSNTGTNYYCTTAHTSNVFATDLAASKWVALTSDIVEVPSPYLEADLFDLHFVQSADVLTIVHPSYAPRELRRLGAVQWALTTISFAPSVSAPTNVTATATVGAGAKTYNYVVTAITPDGLEESVASADDDITNDLSTSGNYNTITWTNVSGAVRYNVYKEKSGLFGYIGQGNDGTTGFKDDNISADATITPPEAQAPFTGANNYPGAVSYFEQRRCFAGTNNKPQNIWLTCSATESNLNYSIPTQDNDAISVRIAAREANTIRHLVPLSDLVLLTSGGEWECSSGSADALTPTTIQIKPQSYMGANNVQPVVTGNSILYAQDRGARIREISYSWESQAYRSLDASLMAPHLFDGYTIDDMAYMRSPYQVLWCVRSDGALLGLTYVPDQQVLSWHKHHTDGQVESVAIIAEGEEDVLYVVAKRTINGSSVRYVEQLSSRQFARLQDAFFVDCGATLNNTVAKTLTPGTGADTVGSTGVTFTTGAAHWSAGDVGKRIHYDYETFEEGETTYSRASALITGYTNNTIVTATIEEAFPSTALIASSGWRITTTSISGLSHLEGEEVVALADGAVVTGLTVTSGAVTLPSGASVVHIGLPITAELQTLPLAIEVHAGGQGRLKNVNAAFMRVYRSSGILVGPDEASLVEFKQRTAEPYGSPPALRSDEIEITLSPKWGRGGQLVVQHTTPLPLTVVSLSLDVAVGN